MITEVDTTTSTMNSDGDHDLFAHYVEKSESLRAMVEGTPCEALCGKVWVPFRNPDKLPICPTCKEIYEKMFE